MRGEMIWGNNGKIREGYSTHVTQGENNIRGQRVTEL